MNTAELDLIHRELDGENSPQESRRLQALLAENGEARSLFDELSVVDSRLRQAEMVEPPVWLKRRIMDAIPARRQTSSVGIASFFRGLLETMQARPALAYVYTFVVGLAAGLALFAVALQDSATAEGDLYGTFIDAEALENLSAVGTTPIQLPGFVGEVEVLAARGLLVVDLSIEAEERADVRLIPEPSLTLRGFTRRLGNSDASFDVEEDAVVLDVQGSERYSLLFDRAGEGDSVVRLEVHRDGRLMYEDRLRAE